MTNIEIHKRDAGMIDKFRKELGKALKASRTSQKISSYRVQKDAGLSYMQVKKIETGEGDIQLKQLILYCEAIGAKLTISTEK